MRSLLVVSLSAALISVAGCASKATKTESTVSGTLALGTYPSSPTAIVAADEAGRMTAAAVGSDARFTLRLTKGHKYRLFVEGASQEGNLPVVFPRANGQLDTSFTIRTGGAIVDLGVTRYAADGLAGFQVKTGTRTPSPPTLTSGDEPGECVDGKVAGTGMICVDDDDKTSCENGFEGEDDDDEECVNGLDAKTGAPCVDPVEPGDEADASKPMAVPEKSPPNEVDGCNEEDDDDDVEQEGEHED